MKLLRRLRQFALIILALSLVSNARADQAGRTALPTLTRSIGARPSSIGEAFTAIPGDIQAINYNPASLARIESPILSATYLQGIIKDSLNIVNYAQPFTWGTIFVGATYFDAGTIDLNLSSGVQESRKAQTDLIGTVGFSVGKTGPISFGGTAKYIKSELAEEATGTGMAFDAGLLWKPPIKGFHIGASVLNLGSDFKYEQEADPLPLAYRGGASYQVDYSAGRSIQWLPYRLLFSADAVKVKEESVSFNGGFELQGDISVMEKIGYSPFRVGYLSGSKAYTLGAGFWFKRVTFDYGVHLVQDFTASHRVTLGFLF